MSTPPKPSRTARKSSRLPPTAAAPPEPLRRRLRRGAVRLAASVAGVFALLVLVFSFAPPLINIYQLQEAVRLGGIEKDWVSWRHISPDMARAVVAAEDANFCNHWGFDIAAIKDAVSEGSNRGASTLTQQVVKNVFLWQGRSYIRKAMEAVLTPVVEFVWSKQRILEVYLNIAEFGEGVFGVQAAAQHHFGVDARDLTPLQAARLAAVLPDPKDRNAANPSGYVRRRANSILSGAETIAADGRARCFDYR